MENKKNIYQIDIDRVNNIENEVKKVFYKTLKVKKYVEIKEDGFDSIYFDMFVEDITDNLKKFSNDILFLENENKRDYSNIFLKDFCLSGVFDIKRLKGLTKKEKEYIEYNYNDVYIDINYEDYIYIYERTDVSDEFISKLRKKIRNSIIIEEVVARGYGQGEYEKYFIIFYKDTKNYSQILDTFYQLKNLFSITSFSIDIYKIEVREYKDGHTEEVKVREDIFCDVSYIGDYDKLVLKYQEKFRDYEIIDSDGIIRGNFKN